MSFYCQLQQHCQRVYTQATDGYKPVVSELVGTAKIGYGVVQLANSVAQEQVFAHQIHTSPEDVQKHTHMIGEMRDNAVKNLVEGGQQVLPVFQSLLPLCRKIR